MTEGSGLYLAGPALVKSAIGQEVSQRGTRRRDDARRRSAARSTTASRTTRRAWSGCGGWSAGCAPDPTQPPAPFARQAAAPPARPATRSVRPGRVPIRATSTKCATCSTASSTPAASTSTRPSTARRSSAARPASAAFRSASSPTSSSACKPADGPIAVRRRDLCRQRRQGGPVRHGLQPGLAADPVPAGRQRLHGRPRQRAGGHHQGRGEAGQRHQQQPRAEAHA